MAKAASITKVTKAVSYKFPTNARRKLMDRALTKPRRKAKISLPMPKKAAGAIGDPRWTPENALRRTEVHKIRQLLIRIIPLPAKENPRVIRPKIPLQKLPLSLGRKKLATWWWQACPVCDHGDCAQFKPSRSSFCRRHCLPLAKAVDCLSKSMIDIDETGELSIVGKNPNLVHIDDEMGEKKLVTTILKQKTVTIGNTTEDPYMKFRLEIFEERNPDKECRKAPDTVDFLSSKKRKKNTVTPSPHGKNGTDKRRQVLGRGDDDLTWLSGRSPSSAWIFPANIKRPTRKRPRSLNLTQNESEHSVQVRQSTRCIDVPLQLSDENTPSPSRLPGEEDASKISTPRHNHKSSSDKHFSFRERHIVSISKAFIQRHKRHDDEIASTGEPLLCSSPIPARRELFARSADDPMRNVNTESNSIKNKASFHLEKSKVTREMPQSLSVLTDKFEEGQDGLGEAAHPDADINITVHHVKEAVHSEKSQFCTSDRGKTTETTTYDSKQEMIRLLLALKMKEQGQEEDEHVSNAAPCSTHVSARGAKKEGGFSPGASSIDSKMALQPCIRGAQSQNENKVTVMEEKPFSKRPHLSSSNSCGGGDEASISCNKVENYSIATEKTTDNSTPKQADRTSKEKPFCAVQREYFSHSFTIPCDKGQISSRNEAPRESLGLNSGVNEKSQQPVELPASVDERVVLTVVKLPSQSQSDSEPSGSHDTHLHCQQESQADMISNINGEFSEHRIESPQILPQNASHNYNSQKVERQQFFSQKMQDVSDNAYYQQKLTQQEGYKVPSVLFQGLLLATGSQSSPASQEYQATQLSQNTDKPIIEIRSESEFGEASSQSDAAPLSQQIIARKSATEGVTGSKTCSNPYNRAMTQASLGATSPLEEESEVSTSSIATSEVLSMPFSANQPSTQTSLLVLEDEKSQLEFTSRVAADYQNQIQGRQPQDRYQSIRTLEHWKQMQAAETLHSKSSRALAKLILAKNSECSNPASFWLPALLDEI